MVINDVVTSNGIPMVAAVVLARPTVARPPPLALQGVFPDRASASPFITQATVVSVVDVVTRTRAGSDPFLSQAKRVLQALLCPYPCPSLVIIRGLFL